jgi:hypothetical protein
MQGELRVTVIATGFDTADVTPAAPIHRGVPVIPLPVQRQARAAALPPRPPLPADRPQPKAPRSPQDLNDMEIPTFIRRQMD